jgi:protein-disulfide isomerase
MNNRVLSTLLLVAAVIAVIFAVSQSQSLSQTQATLAAQLNTATAQVDALAQQATRAAAALTDAATQAADAQATALANAENAALANQSTAVAEAEGALSTQSAATLSAVQDLNVTQQAQAIATVEAQAAATQSSLGITFLLTLVSPPVTPTVVNNGAIDYSSMPQSRSSEGGFVIGNPDAPITVLQFTDWACPSCHNYLPTIDRFIRDYVVTGRAKFELYIFPTAGGASTAFAGGIAECLDTSAPGAFWEASSRFYELSLEGRYQDAPRIIASELGVSYADLLTCQADSTHVSNSSTFAQTLNVTGTPAVLIRYGDEAPTFITSDGETYNRGGVPFNVLSAAVETVQTSADQDSRQQPLQVELYPGSLLWGNLRNCPAVRCELYKVPGVLPEEVAAFYQQQMNQHYGSDEERCIRIPEVGQFDTAELQPGQVPYMFRCRFDRSSFGTSQYTTVMIMPGLYNENPELNTEGMTVIRYDQVWQQ